MIDIKGAAWRYFSVGLVGFVSIGCAQTRPGQHLIADAEPHTLRAKLEFVGHEERRVDTLQELIDLAIKSHPDLRAAQARVEAARGRMIQAGLYPNPQFGPNFSQLGDSSNRLGEPGARIIQTIVTGDKLRIAKAAAAHGVEAADWQATTRLHDVVTRVRLAYYELLTAERELQTMNELVRVSTESQQTAKSLEKAGTFTHADVLRAKVEHEQNRNKREASLHRVETAQQNLATSLGTPLTVPGLIDPLRRELEQIPPAYEWRNILAHLLKNSAELREAHALVAQQEKLLLKAQRDVRPNFTVTAIPFYESPNREMRAEVIVTAPLPIFDRNQGNIHAAEADLARARAEVQLLELRLTERLSYAFQRYQVARQQTESYQKNILPDARELLRFIEAGYRGGDKKYDYSAVLQARQVLFQTQLAHTKSLSELWQSVIEISGILQHDDFYSGCAVRERG